MNDVNPSLRREQQQLTQDVDRVLDDAQHLLHRGAGEARKGMGQARDRLQHSVTSALERLTALERTVVARARQAGQGTDGYVRAHPWETIGTGIGLGLALGVLIGLLVARGDD
jgi:ElaB/YqjD/DUF883 family membrane-anchored ribosome-binding protein